MATKQIILTPANTQAKAATEWVAARTEAEQTKRELDARFAQMLEGKATDCDRAVSAFQEAQCALYVWKRALRAIEAAADGEDFDSAIRALIRNAELSAWRNAAKATGDDAPQAEARAKAWETVRMEILS